MNLLDAHSGAERKLADVLRTPPSQAQRKRSRQGTPFTPPVISQDDQNRLRARIKQPKLMFTSLDASPDAATSAAEAMATPLSSQRPLVSGKTFNCLVHGMVSLEPICVQIIDSPPFQRLHNLKQLGTSDYVFRGATHTRFEHSIGVAHLAGQMASALKQNQPELNITDGDILCVKIAGLCHDLGHGPFSHVFDGVFIKWCRPDFKWRHEDGSVNMLRYILSCKGIDPATHGLCEQDIVFIEEMIAGTAEEDRRGRTRSKAYLYDIVNNTRSGLDVDKIDYFERDMKMTNVAGSITAWGDFSRFLKFGVVLPAEPLDPVMGTGELPLMVCYPEKLVDEAVSLFQARFQMHQRVYTHQVVKQIEFMITDALVLADPYILIPGTQTLARPTGEYKMSECIEDMQAFSKLNDSILDIIAFTRPPPDAAGDGLRKAQSIIERIRNRDLYVCVGLTSFISGDSISLMREDDIKDEIISYSHSDSDVDIFDSEAEDMQEKGINRKSIRGAASPTLSRDDIIVEKMHIHHGLKGKNPVDRLRFFPKRIQNANETKETIIGRKVDEGKYAAILPRTFEQRAVRVFCRSADKTEAVRRAFDSWCTRMNAHSPFPSASFPRDEDDDET